MPVEIERKFLVKNEQWRDSVESQARITQGYLSNNSNATVRVRIKGEKAFITIKGASQGVSRSEFEYPIPVDDAEAMLSEMPVSPVVDKVRHLVRCGPHVWELDVFHGENEGLVMAELELGSEDESFELPEWAGEEVSDDPRYYNVNLAQNPYKHW